MSQEQPDLLAEAVADRLATRLVESYPVARSPAERVAGAALPEVNDLVIEGDFARIDAGSRTLRFEPDGTQTRFRLIEHMHELATSHAEFMPLTKKAVEQPALLAQLRYNVAYPVKLDALLSTKSSG